MAVMPLPIRMVPAIDELLPGYEGTWTGIVGPAGTPPTEVIAVIEKVVNAALGDSRFKARGANSLRCLRCRGRCCRRYALGELASGGKILNYSDMESIELRCGERVSSARDSCRRCCPADALSPGRFA